MVITHMRKTDKSANKSLFQLPWPKSRVIRLIKFHLCLAFLWGYKMFWNMKWNDANYGCARNTENCRKSNEICTNWIKCDIMWFHFHPVSSINLASDHGSIFMPRMLLYTCILMKISEIYLPVHLFVPVGLPSCYSK